MQKIQENEINWIKEKEPQSQEVLNRPQKELLSKLGTQPFQDITQEMGNDENKVMSQAQVQREILNILQRISEIRDELHLKNEVGFSQNQTRTNEQNDDVFIQGGSILQDLNGNSSSDIISQKAVTDQVQQKKNQQQVLTPGTGIKIQNREVSFLTSGNLSIDNNQRITKRDTLYSSGDGINVNNTTLNLNIGGGLTIKNNALTIQDNYIDYNNLAGAPQVPTKYGLSIDGQTWTSVPSPNKSYTNDKSYPIFILQIGDGVKITHNGFVFNTSRNPGNIITIIPPQGVWKVEKQTSFFMMA